MSSVSSIGTYDSLFDEDDDGGTFSGIRFDLDVHQAVSCEDNTSNNIISPWCKATNSSCCSLCRPRVMVSGAGNDLIGPSVVVSCDSSGDGGAPTNPSELKLTPATNFKNTKPLFHPEISDSIGISIKSISIPRRYDSFVAQSCNNNNLPPTVLPADALCHVFRFLDVASLCHVRTCSTELCDAVSKDNSGWIERCKRLWSRKANVCSAARDLLTQSNMMSKNNDASSEMCAAMEAYTFAITDAATRSEISMEELCFDEASSGNEAVVWSFRFKESAGRDWTSWDPWWNGQDARKLVFLRDGTVLQAYPHGVGQSVTTCNGIQLFDVFSERTAQRDGVEVPARIQMKWRFVNHSLDLPTRPNGAYVRITVEGRDVPTYVVRRSHNGNWGFILESCWGIYASYELAPQVFPSSTFGRRSIRRTRNGGWVDVEDSDGEDDRAMQNERMRNVRRRIALFEEESTMTQNAYSQWREALLYNTGAVILPERYGSEMIEIQNAWRSSMERR